MDPTTLDLIKNLGVPIAVLLVVLALFLRGKIHSDAEYQEMKAQRDHYRDQIEKLIVTTRSTFPVVQEAVQKRAEVSSLADMAGIVDEARAKGLLP